MGRLAHAAAAVPTPLQLYRRLPEELRRCLRPLNLLEECGSVLPDRLRVASAAAAEGARRMLQLGRTRYPVRRFVGQTRVGARELRAIVAADDQWTRYWTRSLFAGEPEAASLGDVMAGRVVEGADRVGRDVDLSLWQAAWPVARRLRDHALVPGSVPLWLRTDRPMHEIIRGERAGRGSRRDDARRVRRLGLTIRVTHDARHHDWFRRELYEPYTSRRFGDLFLRVPRHAFRHARRHGTLLLLERRSEPVAGALLERWNGDVRVLAFGVRTDADVPSGLLLEACYFHAIAFAVDAKLPRLSLGACRPVLTDGVLRYKRKWGAYVGAPNTWDAFVVRYRNTAAVRAALTATPLVIERGAGRLVALTAAHDVSIGDQVERIDIPGLAEIACLTAEGDATSASGRVRVVPAPGIADGAATR